MSQRDLFQQIGLPPLPPFPGIRDTSREAYAEIVATGTVGKQAQSILDFVRSRLPYRTDWSLQELSDALEMPINAVSGRVNDLKKLDKLVECDKRKCRITGRTIRPVRIP